MTVNREFYSDGSDNQPKRIDDFSDEEILKISGELNFCDTQEEYIELKSEIKKKYNLDSLALSQIQSRAFELRKLELENTSGAIGDMLKMDRKAKEERESEKIRLSGLLVGLKDKELSSERAQSSDFLASLVGPSRIITTTPMQAAELLGIQDIQSEDLHREISKRNAIFQDMVYGKIHEREITAKEATKIRNILVKCSEILTDAWFKEYGNELEIGSVIELMEARSDYNFELDEVLDKVYCAINYGSVFTRAEASEIIYNSLKKSGFDFFKGENPPWKEEYSETYGEYGEDLTKEEKHQSFIDDYSRWIYRFSGLVIAHGQQHAEEISDLLVKRWPKELQFSNERGNPPIDEFSNALTNNSSFLTESNIAYLLQKYFQPNVTREEGMLEEFKLLEYLGKLSTKGRSILSREAGVNLINKELTALIQLESEIPGAMERLKEEFNIEFPGRYSIEVTRELLQLKKDKPFGLIIYPKSDYSAAFHHSVEHLEKLSKQLKEEGYNLLVTETDNKIGLVRTLLKINKEFGKDHKISFLILGGHGSQNSIHFGDVKHGTLKAEDIQGQGIKRLRDMFEENATLIMESCSTGKDDGIAQVINKFFGINVIAPKEPTFVESVDVQKIREGLQFKVVYHNNNQAVFLA